MSNTYVPENALARERLFALTAKLHEDDLTCRLANGWSASDTLVHLPFWDRYYLSLVEEWERTGFSASACNVKAINQAVCLLSGAIPPMAVVPLVRDAAEAIDHKLEGLTPELASAIREYCVAPCIAKSISTRLKRHWVWRTMTADEPNLLPSGCQRAPRSGMGTSLGGGQWLGRCQRIAVGVGRCFDER